MNATYVDVNEFTVVTDRTAEFVAGRRIKADCGVNGIKYCTVLSSNFGATTTVITKESELTANLTTVLYGIVEPKTSGSLPDHSHDGTEGSGGSALGDGGDVTFAQSIIVDEIRSNTGGLILGGYGATFTDIDFTDPAWTEVDPGTDIVVAAKKVTWTALPRNLDSHVYYDYGADYFDGNFRHEFECELTSADDSGAVYPWGLANAVDDFKGIDNANGSILHVLLVRSGANYLIGLSEVDSGALSQVFSTISTGTTYYLTVVRDENVGTFGTIYLYIYTDVARTVLHEKLEVTLNTSKKDFRYLYTCNTHNDGTAPAITGWMQNLRLSTDPFGIEKGIFVHDSGIVDMKMQSGCRVYLSEDLALTAGVEVDVPFDEEFYDMQNEWNRTTYRFTAKEYGIYSIKISGYFIVTADQDGIYFRIRDNGSNIGYARLETSGTASQTLQAHIDVELDPNDYIYFRVENGDNDDTLNSGFYLTYACIAKIA